MNTLFCFLGILFLFGLLITFIFFLYRKAKESHPAARKMNRLAITSMVLGLLSFCPSLVFIYLATSAENYGDFQGGAMLILLFLALMAPTGLVSIVIGIQALITIAKNRTKVKGRGFAIAGIILGLPGLFNLLFYML